MLAFSAMMCYHFKRYATAMIGSSRFDSVFPERAVGCNPLTRKTGLSPMSRCLNITVGRAG